MSLRDRVFEASPHSIRVLGFNAYAVRLRWQRERGPLRQRIDQLEAVDRLGRSLVASYQLEQLNALLSWARERVPYYRESPEYSTLPALSSLDDLDRLPKLQRRVIQSQQHRLHAERTSLHHGHTSGTTGSPLQLVYDLPQRVWNRAAEKIVRIRAGLSPADRVAVVWGRRLIAADRTTAPFWIPNWADHELWLSAFHISPKTASVYFDAIARFRSSALETYPSIAYLLACLARDQKIRVRIPRVLTTSETLFPFQRALIEEVFGAEVFDYYGCAERVAFAVECRRHDGLHLLEGYGYVEPTVSGQREGGKPLVATGLTNRGMPLLRYEMHDVTEVLEEPCPCGLASRRLAPVTTKREDALVTPDGRLVSSSVLTHPFKPLVGVRRSQIEQEALDRVVVRLETTTGFDERQSQGLLAELQERLGVGVAISIVTVDEIAQESSGKFRWVISRVKGPHQIGELGGRS